MDPVMLFVIAVVVGTVFMVIRGERQKKAAAKKLEVAVHEALRAAADELTLTEPIAVVDSLVSFSSSGTIHGAKATLAVGMRGWHHVAIQVSTPDLPAEVRLTRKPRGKGQEDYQLEVVADSGNSRFDEQHCVAGPPHILKDHAKSIDVKLLDFVSDHYDHVYEIDLDKNELRIIPGPDTLPYDGAFSMRWDCTPTTLIRMWRHAERIVEAGISRGVLVRPD